MTFALPQRKTLKALRRQWEVELLRVLQQTKAITAYQAHEGQPSLYPFLCLLSEEEFVSLLMQVGQGWRLLGVGQMAAFRQPQLGFLSLPRFCRSCQRRASPSSTWPTTWAFGC